MRVPAALYGFAAHLTNHDDQRHDLTNGDYVCFLGSREAMVLGEHTVMYDEPAVAAASSLRSHLLVATRLRPQRTLRRHWPDAYSRFHWCEASEKLDKPVRSRPSVYKLLIEHQAIVSGVWGNPAVLRLSPWNAKSTIHHARSSSVKSSSILMNDPILGHFLNCSIASYRAPQCHHIAHE